LERVQALGLAFQLDFWRARLGAQPGDVEALSALAETCSRLGLHGEALAFDRRLALHRPDDALVRYNLACSLALNGLVQDALDQLECALELGFDDAGALAADADLAALRGEARYRELLGRLSGG
jgi:adenylate cyclase